MNVLSVKVGAALSTRPTAQRGRIVAELVQQLETWPLGTLPALYLIRADAAMDRLNRV